MNVLISSLWVALVLYLLYETSVVYSYFSVLPNFMKKLLDPLNHFWSYELDQKHNKNWSLSYADYVTTNHGGFIVSLFTCRYCLGAWLAIAASILFGIWEYVPATYFLSQIEYTGFRLIDKTLTNLGENKDE